MLLILSLSIPCLALTQSGNGSATHNVNESSLGGSAQIGVKRNYNGSTTYGFSWVNPANNSIMCWSQTRLSNVTSKKAYGLGYAQTSQIYASGAHSVSELHGRG